MCADVSKLPAIQAQASTLPAQNCEPDYQQFRCSIIFMKIILSSPNPGEIAQLRDMLESGGIACLMRNEMSAGYSEIPLSESTPELWIQDEQKYVQALRIKTAWQISAPVEGENWACPTCGENSEPQFTSCWKCGSTKP
ncbi:MAG: DUF2007 domain-containing protein [Verrucomicrobia bacterium]|jgi:hypothetical protein|nr:MAG: DUF2007 domain-containing protein [Verrucomicrobiota bacterium]